METVIANLADAFRRSSRQVEIVTVLPGEGDEGADLVVFRNYWLQGRPLLRGRGHPGWKRVLLSPLLIVKRLDRRLSLRRFRQFIETLGDDALVLLTSDLTAQMLADTGYRPGRGAVVVGQYHGAFNSAGIHPPTLRKLRDAFRHVEGLVVLSAADAEQFAEIVEAPTFSVPNPHAPRDMVSADDAAAGAERRARVVVALARFSPEKRLDHMIRIFLRATSSDPSSPWELHLYGEGPERGKLEELVRASGTDRVKLMGWTDDSALVFRQAHMNMLTSRTEGFGMTVLEAARAQIPTMAYDCSPGLRELMLNVDGYLIPQDDEDQYVTSLRRVLGHPDELVVRGRNAAQGAQQYSAERVVAQWGDVVSRLYGMRGD
ncbi:MAG: glycosyltransferase [Microbacterium sp.]